MTNNNLMSDQRKLAQGFPPSEFIIEEMEERGWSKETLADQMGVRLVYLEPILADKRRLTKLACHVLGNAFGTGPEYWHNLQTAWDEWSTTGYISTRTAGR